LVETDIIQNMAARFIMDLSLFKLVMKAGALPRFKDLLSPAEFQKLRLG